MKNEHNSRFYLFKKRGHCFVFKGYKILNKNLQINVLLAYLIRGMDCVSLYFIYILVL